MRSGTWSSSATTLPIPITDIHRTVSTTRSPGNAYGIHVSACVHAMIDAASSAGHDAVAEDMAFHRTIAVASGNPQFVRLLAFLEQYLREAMRVTKANEARRDDFMHQVRREHRAIVEAIAAHDAPAARRAAVAHLLYGEWRLQEGGVIPRRRGRVAPPGAASSQPRRGA